MRALLVDDHPLFIDGLRNLLTSKGVNVVATARDGLEAIEQVREVHPDVVLMDIQMPRMDGLAALRRLKSEFPDLKVVILTMSAGDEELFQAVKGGACGYLLKTLDTEEVLRLLGEVERGEVALSPGLAGRIFTEFARRGPKVEEDQRAVSLSPREQQVLTLVATGLTYKEVGSQLFLSERTIKYHMGEIVAKLHVQNRAAAVQFARRTGMVR